MTARVLLGDTPVGRLDVIGRVVGFSFDAAYLARPDRPVLGRWFEDQAPAPDRVFAGVPEAPLPAFFRNLLPEGALRKVLEARLAQRGVWAELEMLLRLGEDLPGAVRVVEEGEVGWDDDPRPVVAAAAREGDPLRFSLAGVQLKASVLATEERVTLPLVGQGGDFIAKFPSAAIRLLPENEHAMLAWARAAGLDVPDHRLVDVAAIEGLPEEFPREGRALLVRRFDRLGGGRRLHQEDFAQVFGVEPDDKYVAGLPPYAHHAGLGAVVRALCGEADFREYVRRFVLTVLAGNGDAHAKNWALVYPDGVHARLSPLYDVVATVAYPRFATTLALGVTDPEDPDHLPGVPMTAVGWEHVRAIADRAGADPDDVEADARAFAARAREAWREVEAGAPEIVRESVRGQLGSVRLA